LPLFGRELNRFWEKVKEVKEIKEMEEVKEIKEVKKIKEVKEESLGSREIFILIY